VTLVSLSVLFRSTSATLYRLMNPLDVQQPICACRCCALITATLSSRPSYLTLGHIHSRPRPPLARSWLRPWTCALSATPLRVLGYTLMTHPWPHLSDAFLATPFLRVLGHTLLTRFWPHPVTHPTETATRSTRSTSRTLQSQ
jgi:hypothetical protein